MVLRLFIEYELGTLLINLSLFNYALDKRITNMIGEIPVFSLGLVPPLEITDAPKVKNRLLYTIHLLRTHWQKHLISCKDRKQLHPWLMSALTALIFVLNSLS